MSVEQKVKDIFKEVLDIPEDEIKPDEKMDESLGIDSTEMVELTVAIKKAFGLEMENQALNKGQTFNEMIAALKDKGAQ